MKAITNTIVLLLTLTVLPATNAQDASNDMVRIEKRFSGNVTMDSARIDGAAAALSENKPIGVEILNISLTGEQRIDSLPVDSTSTLIVQLRSGELSTEIDGNRASRDEGEFWTVMPGQTMILVTEDDSAVISVTEIKGE